MSNPYRGDVTLVLNGVCHPMRLTLGALAELETELEAGSLMALVERFEAGKFTTGDLVRLLGAGLRGAGAKVTGAELLGGEIEGGAAGAARCAAALLARAFSFSEAA